MDTCSTWHIRIELVGDENNLAARAKLVGAPLTAACAQHAQHRPECPACQDLRAYTNWQELPGVVSALVDALEAEHLARAAGDARAVAVGGRGLVPPQR